MTDRRVSGQEGEGRLMIVIHRRDRKDRREKILLV